MKSRYLLILPCLLLIKFIVVAWDWGLADISAISARRNLALWENDASTLNNLNWVVADNSITKAIKLDPMNPRLLTLSGNLLEWKTYLDISGEERNHNLAMALNNYRHSAKLRSTWPYTWGHISLVKYRLGEIDKEFYQAIEKATLTGPWEPWVQQVVAETGLSTWQRLDKINREKVVRNIHRGTISQPHIMLSILKKYGQLKIVCYQKIASPLINEFCENKSGKVMDKNNESTFLKLSDKLKKL